ncbi:hypothetical protein [Streptomyces sp. NPDC090021]|uniref:hypothetical protein n=1 Tax=Streptomyces sp. NPDC090021 TaxID=3365919 RepID=UPI00381BC32F
MSSRTSGREAATGAAARPAVSGWVRVPESGAAVAAALCGVLDRLPRGLSPR